MTHRYPDEPGRAGMPQWLRNAVMLVVLTVWAAFMASSLIRGTPVDAIAWGVPGAVYFALQPTWPGRGRGDQDPPETPTAPTTGGGAA